MSQTVLSLCQMWGVGDGEGGNEKRGDAESVLKSSLEESE